MCDSFVPVAKADGDVFAGSKSWRLLCASIGTLQRSGADQGWSDESVSTARALSTAKVMTKGRTSGSKVKARDQERKGRLPTRDSEATAGRAANGAPRRPNAGKGMFKEWRTFRSLPQVAANTMTTTAAAKTAVAIEEVVNDENESGWIFGMNSGSVAAATRDRDDLGRAGSG